MEFANVYFVSGPMLGGKSVSLNIDGLSELAHVSVEVIDAKTFRPVPGYSSQECQPVESGLQSQVTWQARRELPGTSGPVRNRVNYGGARPEDPRLYAIYVKKAA